MKTDDTATRLLDVAQGLVQERGYNAFSYKDLADEVGIRTASIHYHFATKAELGCALIDRYAEGLSTALAEIDRTARSNKGKLRRYVKIYRETASRQMVCLCGSLASDLPTLREDLQERVRGFIDVSEAWVKKTITAGVASGEFREGVKPREAATLLVAGSQGALFFDRGSGGSASLDRAEKAFFELLGA